MVVIFFTSSISRYQIDGLVIDVYLSLSPAPVCFFTYYILFVLQTFRFVFLAFTNLVHKSFFDRFSCIQ